VVNIFDAGLDDIQMLLHCQAGRLTGRSADDHRVGSAGNLLLQELLQFPIIYTLVRIHRSDNRNSGTLEYRHNLPPLSTIVLIWLVYI
jgi:hypothetical protein